MKKRLIIPAALVLMALCCSSCDEKACYCYERVSSSQVRESIVYVDIETPCSSQSRGGRGCIESNERGTINPEDIAK